MIELIPYDQKYEAEILPRIHDFFGSHVTLLDAHHEMTEKNIIQARKTIREWLGKSYELYLVIFHDCIAGFICINYRGDNVVWINAIYVDEKVRKQGIATAAIQKAENIIQSKPGFTAICFDVVPRNIEALYLYHKLGYDSLSIVTVRKELYDNKRDRLEKILNLDFKNIIQDN